MCLLSAQVEFDCVSEMLTVTSSSGTWSRSGFYRQGARGWLRLNEKGGPRHDVPAPNRAAAGLDAYIEAGGL